MTTIRLTGRFCIALALSFALAAPASAASAWWHGVRSNNWQDGIASGQSNWYSLAPPNGTAQPVPDKTAKFAPGAKVFEISIGVPTTVETMDFRNNPPRYTFTVNDTFSLTGKGVNNPSSITPLFIVQAIMVFLNKSNTGHADYDIRAAGTLTVDATRGLLGNRVLQIGEVKNAGRFDVGRNTLRMSDDFQQTSTGLLKLDEPGTAGGLIIGKNVTLAGELVVEGRRNIAPGRYLLITADTRTGKFATVNFIRFNTNLVNRAIEYGADRVVLVVTKK